MHMVSHPTNALRKSAKPVHGSAEVLVQSRLPLVINQRCPVFGRENDVIVKRKKCRFHKEGKVLASLRDADVWVVCSGGVAALNHRLIAANPTGSKANV
jgi:hypothetical protein